uniref:Uncharacterized protein n=1 Tax=Setaria digitata TaxID=48799 RepID=A0A915PTH0_9BILA
MAQSWNRFSDYNELASDEKFDLHMNNDYDQQQRQPRQQQPLAPRMGRRFTLNPLIFAKEERELRRQSLAQLKLSYYPKNASR